MKIKCSFVFVVFLLALAASGFASAIMHIHKPDPLVVGSVIQFSVTASYEEVACENPDGSRVVSWFVACENGGGWRSESLHGEADAGWQTLDFEVTYTVTPGDVNNPNFCFMLYSRSGCWVTDRPVGSAVCPPVKIMLPHIRLEKYIECWRVPGCPNCLKLDLGQLIRTLGDPLERVQVVLLRNGVQLAMLGEVGRGRRLPAQFQVTLPEDAGIKRQRQVASYQLRVLGKNGKVLASEDVTLKIK